MYLFKYLTTFIQLQATYARWFEEHQIHIQELRLAIYYNKTDEEIRHIVEKTKSQFHDIFCIKQRVAKDDFIHIVYGMWTTPAERCIMLVGGFRTSDILKASTKD